MLWYSDTSLWPFNCKSLADISLFGHKWLASVTKFPFTAFVSSFDILLSAEGSVEHAEENFGAFSLIDKISLNIS